MQEGDVAQPVGASEQNSNGVIVAKQLDGPTYSDTEMKINKKLAGGGFIYEEIKNYYDMSGQVKLTDLPKEVDSPDGMLKIRIGPIHDNPDTMHISWNKAVQITVLQSSGIVNAKLYLLDTQNRGAGSPSGEKQINNGDSVDIPLGQEPSAGRLVVELNCKASA